MGRKLYLALLTVAVVAACTGGGAPAPSGSSPSPAASPSPSPEGPLATPAFVFEPSLEDRSGLVAGMAPANLPDPFEEKLVVAATDGPGLVISWPGSPCEVQPTVLVEGTADDLTLTIYGGPVLPGECPAMLAYRAVLLTLTTPVDPADVKGSLREGKPPG